MNSPSPKEKKKCNCWDEYYEIKPKGAADCETYIIFRESDVRLSLKEIKQFNYCPKCGRKL